MSNDIRKVHLPQCQHVGRPPGTCRTVAIGCLPGSLEVSPPDIIANQAMNPEIRKRFLGSPQGIQVAARLRTAGITPEDLFWQVYSTVLPALHGLVTVPEYGFAPGWQFRAKDFFESHDWRHRPHRERICIGLVLSFLTSIGMVPLELHPGRAQTGAKVYLLRTPLDWVWPEL